MAELDAVGFSAVLSADAKLDIGASLLALGDGDLHELADAGLVYGGKGVFLHDFEFLIGPEEGARIVAAHAQRGLGEIVRAEAEELRGLGDFVGRERTAWDFDHGADK